MRNFRSAGMIIVSVIGMAAALPAQADTSRTMDQTRIQQRASMLRSPCARSLADSDCAMYQSQAIKAVETRALASAKPVSMHDVGGLQLDALLATLN